MNLRLRNSLLAAIAMCPSIAEAWAPDGHIEGAESAPGQPWLLAVQWHPEEFHHHDGAPDHGLFAAFVAESRRVTVAR